MANFRYTIEELEKKDSPNYLSDFQLLVAILNERQGSCTNIYSPLYKRLDSLKKKISALHTEDKKLNIEDIKIKTD